MSGAYQTHAVRVGRAWVAMHATPTGYEAAARVGGSYYGPASYVLRGADTYRTLAELRTDYPDAVRSPEYDRSPLPGHRP